MGWKLTRPERGIEPANYERRMMSWPETSLSSMLGVRHNALSLKRCL